MDKNSEELNDIKGKYKKLNEEHDKLRNRLKNIRTKFKNIGNQDIKYCKMRGKEYIETENYNWSCRTHKS